MNNKNADRCTRPASTNGAEQKQKGNEDDQQQKEEKRQGGPYEEPQTDTTTLKTKLSENDKTQTQIQTALFQSTPKEGRAIVAGPHTRRTNMNQPGRAREQGNAQGQASQVTDKEQSTKPKNGQGEKKT